MVASVGIVGGLLWLAIAMGLSPRGLRVRVLFSLLLVLLAAPIWTMMFWWAWLGLLLNRSLVESKHGTGALNTIRKVHKKPVLSLTGDCTLKGT